jgi:hypothetical protein
LITNGVLRRLSEKMREFLMLFGYPWEPRWKPRLDADEPADPHRPRPVDPRSFKVFTIRKAGDPRPRPETVMVWVNEGADVPPTTEAGDWIRERLDFTDPAERIRVRSVIQTGFEAYARIPHPTVRRRMVMIPAPDILNSPCGAR